jgi:hypothetical protein
MPRKASNFRKPGLAGRIQKLNPEQREELWNWLEKDRISYGLARERVLERFGVQTSQTALSTFWRREHERRLLDRAHQAKETRVLLDVSFEAATRLQVVQIGTALQIKASQPAGGN